MSEKTNLRVRGEAISPGVVLGPAFVHQDLPDCAVASSQIIGSEVGREFERLDSALECVMRDLKISAKRIEAESGPELAAIFSAHEAILDDASLREEIRNKISSDLFTAAYALARVFRGWREKFQALPHQILRDRADDLRDLEGRLLRQMAGIQSTSLEKMPSGRILVAHRLLPSETVILPHRAVLGIVLEFGGPGSHAALLARALGIPTVAQIPDATGLIKDGQEVIVNGLDGEVILSPDSALKRKYEQRSAQTRAHVALAKKRSSKPVRTADGVEVQVLANVSGREDVEAAVENGADGVGLYRVEQFYLSRKTPPSTGELLEELEATFAPMHSKPITVRFLDLGADKPVPFLNFPAEDDPFLGRRGVRLLLRYPDLLTTQLHAFLQFSRQRDLRILVPMVTLPRELEEISRRLREAAEIEKIQSLPLLGAMIETPAAALTVGQMTEFVQFLSVGTNDLTQYTMAAGRENPLVNEYFLEDNPAVLRLIRIAIEDFAPKPVAVCGELAAHLPSIATLLELGVRQLSVAPPMIPLVKETVRKVKLRTRS